MAQHQSSAGGFRKSLASPPRLTATRRLLAILVVVVSLIGGPVSGVQAATTITFTGAELLGRPTDTSIMITIVPASTIQYYYEYGTASATYTAQTDPATATGGQPGKVVIEELDPNTRYYYRMKYHLPGETDWVTRAERSFWTQRARGSTFTFTITSDSHVNIMLGQAATWDQTMDNVAADHPDFHLDLGDTFAMDGVTSVTTAETNYKSQYQFFNLVSHSASIFIAPGNHEQQEGWHLDDTPDPALAPPIIGANAQKKYFPNPVPDAFYSGNTDPHPLLSGDKLREDYYAWEWGDALFVVFDPFWYTMQKPFAGNTGGGEPEAGDGDRWHWTLGQAQYNWLKQTLETSHAKYKFLFAHHMVGGSDDYVRGGAVPAHICEWGGYNEAGTTYEWGTKRAGWGDDPIRQILQDNHVSAFFHGHDHQYAHEVRDGVIYESLAAAGFSGPGFGIYNSSPYALKVLDSPGHMRVTIAPDQATVDYVGTTGASVKYSYTIAPYLPPAALPKAPVVTSIVLGGSNDVTLAWDEVTLDVNNNPTDITAYRVYGSHDPFFDPIVSDLLDATTEVEFRSTHTSGSTGDINWYYLVHAVNAAGESATSPRRTGRFGFVLVPGVLAP